ncbi:YdcF family protein [Kocuria rhizophila]|uniref:YdcF family protein n=1 Tax=Kocuria TaxID=57493 RepID=UPI0021503002|nr:MULTISPECIES: YdcF family protein [Kocuria]MCR4525786.1 YdcF family protein [Kocuria rhizophila]MCT1545906.1 YdcF family protein [Kocuria rhizophila]MCT2172217.1 YdcF family protein [Kocuria rhizophila]MDN3462436.1 YdcF family protein [Kocuria sp. APC 4018]WSQ06114.1 YdcF family protein [Kocuria rhizophila]
MTLSVFWWAVAVLLALLGATALSLRFTPYRGWNLALITLTGLSGFSVLWVIALEVFGGTRASLITAVLIGAAVAAATVWLFANGIVMLRREGRTLANLLSLVLAAGLGGEALVLWAVAQWNLTLLGALYGPLLVATAYVVVTLIGFVVYNRVVTGIRPCGPVDAVIVLGSGLIGAAVPPLLAGRLDAGLQAWRRTRDRSGAPPLLIPSGGQGPDEDRAEGDAMGEYLLRQAPEVRDSLRIEDRARTTRENLIFSRELVPAGRDARMVVATSDYHVLRAGRFATDLGMTVRVVGSRTARYYLPSAVLREYAATVRSGWVVHAILLFLLTAPIAWSALAGYLQR